ncbi:MAG: rhodanese-like domain-containing protein [Gammaproteobacteria bacterium]|nr:rhodanese-like domain-containing protein [Gammaproteobacteria bacterium]
MKTAVASMLVVLGCGAAVAEDLPVRITEDIVYVDLMTGDKTVRIQRIQDEENVIDGGFAKTSRKCPPFCIHPMSVAPGVETIGEVELLEFLQKEVQAGNGLVIDARTPSWYQKGTIPGSVNIPFTEFAEDPQSVAVIDLMKRLGVVSGPAKDSWKDKLASWAWSVGLASPDGLIWDFSDAKKLVLWCNGPWCDQSPRAIKSLLALGYPAEKIYYYRGGMQLWQIFGLTVVVPEG